MKANNCYCLWRRVVYWLARLISQQALPPMPVCRMESRLVLEFSDFEHVAFSGACCWGFPRGTSVSTSCPSINGLNW